MDLSRIKALAFDVGGTVIDWHTGITNQLTEFGKEKGIEADFSDIKPQNLDELVRQLNDLTVNIESKETVRVFCE